MNNLKRYKEITGKEFIGNDYSTEQFQNSKAVSNLIKEIEKLNHYKHLYSEVKKQKDDVVECCKNSIKSINEKLENNKEPFEVVDGKIIYLNDYQVVRLKAIRMKCKEILRMLGEIDE